MQIKGRKDGTAAATSRDLTTDKDRIYTDRPEAYAFAVVTEDGAGWRLPLICIRYAD